MGNTSSGHALTHPKVYLVRHGETAWTISGQHTGHTDIALTEQGEREARALAPQLKNKHFAQVFTSPLQRARHTAELAGFGVCAQADPDLTEWDYGIYEARRTADIRAERPGWCLFRDGCPGGETLDEVSLRADRVIGRIRAQEGDVLIFAHRDILRILIARWLNLPAAVARHFYLVTASLNILGYDHGLDEPVIFLLNDGQH
jgi:probable phosphoglycerate mutase